MSVLAHTITWRQRLDSALEGEQVIAVLPHDAVLDTPFTEGAGTAEAPAFLAWTESRVAFPNSSDDGWKWVVTVPRSPEAALDHMQRVLAELHDAL